MQRIRKSYSHCFVLLTLLLLGVAPSNSAKALSLVGSATERMANPEPQLTAPNQGGSFLNSDTQLARAKPIKKLSTPQLIEKAFAAREITARERILYLAYALYEPKSLPLQFRSNVGWYGTQYVQEVQKFLQGVNASATDAVQQELSRLSTLSSTVCDDADGALSFDSTHFHFSYNTIGGGANDTIGGGLAISDYVTSMEATFKIEVTDFGWANPPLCTGGDTCDGVDNPFDRYPIQISNLGGGLYGYVSGGGGGLYAGFIGDNPNTPAVETAALSSCMVLNDDFDQFPEPTAQASLDATTSHEFVHAIQNGYGDPSPREDSMWYESGAAYMEDEIFDNANSDYSYLWPEVNNCLGEWPNNSDPGGISQYSNFLFFRHVAEHNGGTNVAGGGENVMQHFWENVAQGQGELTAYNDALVTAGTNLPDAFHKYAIAAKFEKACSGGYAGDYCFEEGPDYVAFMEDTLPPVQGSIAANPGTYTGSINNNYAVNWVSLPTTGGPYKVTLSNTAAGGSLRGSLVCDTGTSLTVAPFAAVVGTGNSTSIGAFDTTGCTSVVAVITNQEQTAGNPTSCTLQGYTLAVSTVQSLNSSVIQQSVATSYNATQQACAATGTNLAQHTVTPTIHNNSVNTFSNLVFRVKQLEYTAAQGGSQPSLCNATTVVDSGRVGSTFSVSNGSLQGSDNQYNPNDNVLPVFQIGLPVKAAYRFFVNMYSTNAAAADADSVGAAEQYLGSFEYEFNADGELVGHPNMLFLPVAAR